MLQYKLILGHNMRKKDPWCYANADQVLNILAIIKAFHDRELLPTYSKSRTLYMSQGLSRCHCLIAWTNNVIIL